MVVSLFEWLMLIINKLYADSETNLSQLWTFPTCGKGKVAAPGALLIS